jgi:hypothetical protein
LQQSKATAFFSSANKAERDLAYYKEKTCLELNEFNTEEFLATHFKQ